MAVDIVLTEPQGEFFDLECKFPLFVAGYGSGKSFALEICAIRDSLAFEGSRVGIYSDTYDQLRLNLVPRIEEQMTLAGIPYKFNASSNSLTYSFGAKENVIIFRSIDNPKRIIGYETYRAHVDEIEAASSEKKAEEVWRKIIARNRQPHPDAIKAMDMGEKIPAHAQNRVSAYTTPDQGFGFTYKKWSKPASADYQHVRAATESNTHLPDDYVESLKNDYPSQLVEAYLYGHWCNLTSGTVFNGFSREQNASDETVQKGDLLRIGMDFNVTNMSAVVYVTRKVEQPDKSIKTVWHAVDEFVGVYDTPAMIEQIKQKYPEHSVYVYPDATGASRKSVDASTSDILLLQAPSTGFAVYAHKKNPFVRDRIVASNQAFLTGTVMVNSNMCPEYARCLEQLPYDKNGSPDKQGDLDHLPDAGTYPIAYEMPVNRPAHNLEISFAR